MAEAKGDKDKEGRVLIKKDHIRSSVQRFTAFQDYLKHVRSKDQRKEHWLPVLVQRVWLKGRCQQSNA